MAKESVPFVDCPQSSIRTMPGWDNCGSRQISNSNRRTFTGSDCTSGRDLNHAIALMSKHPGIKAGPFEIRPAAEEINRQIEACDAAYAGKRRSEDGHASRRVEMKYMLLIYGAERCWTEDERRECMLESMAICDGLEAQGKLIASAPLHSVTTATSVRVRDGKRQITDGPFAETTEQLGGYYIVDVENLDEAIEIASRLPPVKLGTVEIRPLFPFPERNDFQ